MNLHERTLRCDAPCPVRIYALGRLEVVIDSVPLRFATTAPRKPLELLKALLALGGRDASQNTISEWLWPTSDGDAAYRALITTLYRLRGLLRHRQAITFHDSRLSLDNAFCWVDAWTFERELSAARDVQQLQQALALYRGSFLADHDHPCLFEMRDRLRRRFLRAVLELGQRHESAGDIESAILTYERALSAESLSEDIHCRLMRCLARQGRASAASEIYDRCCVVLRQHCGLTPSRSTQQLYQSMCRGSTA